ncbi:MAG TPA: hypothetical protein VMT79_18855 [Candidatus Binatia bacterium]|nr:hypothetical protein [Candidatus Binatia bacterium]
MREAIERLALHRGYAVGRDPRAVRDHATLVFLDTIGVMLAGSMQPEVAGARTRLTATPCSTSATTRRCASGTTPAAGGGLEDSFAHFPMIPVQRPLAVQPAVPHSVSLDLHQFQDKMCFARAANRVRGPSKEDATRQMASSLPVAAVMRAGEVRSPRSSPRMAGYCNDPS